MKTLKPNELTFQLMVEASPNAIILINTESKIAYLNNFAEELFQYKRQELIDHHLKILVPKTYNKNHPDFLQSYFKNPSKRQMGVNRELFALRRDGTEFPVEIGLNPIVTSDGLLVLASIIDITQRKKANEQFRLVVESAPNAIILVDKSGEISLVNKQTEALFGYSRIELIGQTVEILLPINLKQSHPNLRNMFLAAPQTRAMGAGRDLYARRKDGSEFPVEIGLNPIETMSGNQVLASIIDISERKKIENEVQLYTKKIEEKNKELEQFTYIASHDLQEPLNTIISFIKVIEENSDREFSELEKDSFLFINQASLRMKELIKGLLDYSRLGRRAEVKKLDSRLIVQAVCHDLDYLIRETNTKIIIGELPKIYAFETELRLLFQNLISNAIKFTEPNTSPVISITAEKGRSHWQFTVKDNGIGIDPIYKDKIFIIFQRLHGRNEYEGTGIGLAHCRKIVELHNGDIWVESEVGQGSTFQFTINSNIK
jgi:PAS domain S-box-containing protein